MSTGAFESIAVVGAGTMGHGIALVFALSGRRVSLFDVDEAALDRATTSIASGLDTLVDAGRVTDDEAAAAPDRIEPSTSYAETLADVDLVVEASPERLDVKREVFAALDEHAPDSALLASNTSGLSITEMAAQVQDPTRVLGTHWFNPPYVVPLVEVIYGDETADTAVERVYDLLEGVGKAPIVVQEDIPGFVANRLQTAMDFEAWSLLERGVASAEDIDRAVSASFGLRTPALGVFRKSDFAGLDIVRDIHSTMPKDLDRGTDVSPAILELTEAGHLGLKTGRGVFDWSDRDPDEVAEERDRELLALVDLYEEITAARES